MRRFFAVLLAAVAFTAFAGVATAETFTTAEQALAAKLRYEAPQTETALRAYMPRLMAAVTDFSGVKTYSDMVGDTGAGGVHGLVPAPATGDAAAGKFLAAGGSWSVPLGDVATVKAVKAATISAPADGNAHDTAYTLPAGAVVLDAWLDITTADTVPGSTTISIGYNGAVTDLFTGVDLMDDGQVACLPTLDATDNWVVSTTCGTSLATLVAGASADDRGLWFRSIDPKSGGKTVAYQASAGSNAVVDIYLLLAIP